LIQATIKLSHIFFFNATATSQPYPLSLHGSSDLSLPDGDQDPVEVAAVDRPEQLRHRLLHEHGHLGSQQPSPDRGEDQRIGHGRSEEHTSELQSRENLVCRLLLEKKNKK